MPIYKCGRDECLSVSCLETLSDLKLDVGTSQ